jgi:SAM-dependent methyltransferase
MSAEPTFRHFKTGHDIIGARPLEHRHVEKCRLLESRAVLLDQLPKGGVVAEVGVQRGLFANEILARLQPNEYHGFDLHLNQVDYDAYPSLRSPSVHLHAGDSSANLLTFDDATFDMIYIDGDHSWQGVRNDAFAAIGKLKPQGHLVFNDYTCWSRLEDFEYGVMRIVNQLCDEHDFVMAYLALEPLGYHDVALVASRA